MSQIEVQSATESVYRVISQAILTGKFESGQVLRQDQLAKQLGVSRTPLREALMRLASIGLVQIEPNRSARVTGLDFGNMQHAWMARIILESGAAKQAAANATADTLARMRQAVQRQRETQDNVEESMLVNREFHLALVAASGNPYLIRFSEVLWSFEIAAPIFGPQARNTAELLAWADDHESILNAIAAEDGTLAEALTRRHISAYPPRSQSGK